MGFRSWLFVSGDSEEALGRAVETGADAIIVDLGVSVPAQARPPARQLAAQWLDAHRHQIIEHRPMGRWVRINALDSRMWRDDLIAVMPAAPDGIMLPRASGPEAVQLLAAELYELEQLHHIPSGTTKILPLVNETPQSAMTIGAYLEAPHQRLVGLSWSAEELALALGASRQHDAKGEWTGAFPFARAQTLLTAHGCGVMAIDTAYGDVADTQGLKVRAQAARADGFTGMLAIDPAQVPIINEAFTPTGEEIEEARRVVGAFEATPDAAALHIDRRLIDQPHLKHARRVLELDEAARRDKPRTPILRPA